MREKLDNPNFDYVLLCNKICGAAHWNMQMNIVVDTEEDYLKWLKDQKPFFAGAAPAPADTTAPAGATPPTGQPDTTVAGISVPPAQMAVKK